MGRCSSIFSRKKAADVILLVDSQELCTIMRRHSPSAPVSWLMRSSQGGSTVEKSKEAAEDPSIYGDRASRLGSRRT